MRQCPVCKNETDTPKCSTCGFIFSQDYEHFPTLAPTMSIAARQKAWKERQQSQHQHQQWESERDRTKAELKDALDKCSQAKKQSDYYYNELQKRGDDIRELKHQLELAKNQASQNDARNGEYEKLEAMLAQAIRDKNNAENERRRALAEKERAEEKTKGAEARLRKSSISAACAKACAHVAQAELEREKNKPLRKIFSDYFNRLDRAYFTPKDKDPLLLALLKIFSPIILFIILGALIAYLIVDQVHWVFLHTSLAFDDAPCAERGICDFFPCDVSERHEPVDYGCLMPQSCQVCGAVTGGTTSHIWCDHDADGTTTCHLCEAELTDAWFYRKQDHIENLELKVKGSGFTITFPADSNIPSSKIEIRDHNWTVISNYASLWQENALNVHFTDTPAVGRYTVRAYVNDEWVLTTRVFYGTYGKPTPEWSCSLSRFRAAHLLTGLRLHVEDGTPSVTDKKSSLILELSDLSGDSEATITATSHVYFQDKDHMNRLYTFAKDEQYLAVNTNDEIYWADSLTDECYWIVISEE